MNYETNLNDEIQRELDALSDVEEVGTDEYKTTVDGLTKLIDRSIELKKVENEKLSKTKEQELKAQEHELEKAKANDEKKDRLVRNGIAIAGIIIPSIITIWGTVKSLKFEETGTITTSAGRGFLSRLFPKK